MKLKAWVTKHWVVTCIIAIALLAAVLRFYQLGQVPHGLTWDEAAIGYNGFAIWKIHRDEWLQFMPISFRSFGDYKAPLMIYVTGLFTYVLGMEPWVIRLPAATSGVIGVLGMIWLTWEILEYFGKSQLSRNRKIWWSLVAGLLLATTPWHIHLTRFAMETGLTSALIVLGSAAWFRSLRLTSETLPLFKAQRFSFLNKLLLQPWVWQAFSVSCLALSLYAYHSAKIVVPLLGIGLIFIGRGQLWAHKKLLLMNAVLVLVVLSPLVYDSVWGQGGDRLAQAVVRTEGKTKVQVALQVANNFGLHFTPSFLVGGETPNLRHGDGAWGVFLWPMLVLIIAAVASAAATTKKTPTVITQFTVLAVLVILIGTIPAAIGEEVPHANRALLALPGWIWLAVIGLDWIVQYCSQERFDQMFKGSHGEKQLLLKSVIGTLILSYSLCLLAYLNHYYTVFAKNASDAFQEGYLEAIEYILPYEKGDETHTAVDKIIFDNGYGQPYIFVLMARRTDPIWYHGGSLIKYEFPDKVDAGAILRPNAVIVATGLRDMPWEEADKIIYGSDGSIRFGIFVNQE